MKILSNKKYYELRHDAENAKMYREQYEGKCAENTRSGDEIVRLRDENVRLAEYCRNLNAEIHRLNLEKSKQAKKPVKGERKPEKEAKKEAKKDVKKQKKA